MTGAPAWILLSIQAPPSHASLGPPPARPRPAQGEQERELVRVAVECCLQEGVWNPYYLHLLERLCQGAKGHRVTLQFCLWDHFKEVAGMELRRLTNLARLGGTAVGRGTLPAAVVRTADFGAVLGARETLFWRAFFEHALAAAGSVEGAAKVFGKLAGQAGLETLRATLGVFLRHSLGPWLAGKEAGGAGGQSAEALASLLQRLRAAERALGAGR